MTNPDAIKRIEQKISYLRNKLEGATERMAHFTSLDICAYEMAIDALNYSEQMREYEQSQFPR